MIGNLPFALAAALLVFVLAAFALLAIDTLGQRWRVRRRLQVYGDLLAPGDASYRPEAEAEAEVSLRKPGKRGVEWLDGRFPVSGGVRTGGIALGVAVAASACFLPALVFFGVPLLAAVLAAPAMGLALGWQAGRGIEERRRQAFRARLVVALEDLQRMVRYGISLQNALASLNRNVEEPLRATLGRVLSDTALGVPLDQAMAREARRVGIAELAMLAAIVSTQAATGGNLSESVENLGAMLRERIDSGARMKSATAESRLTLVVLALVPFLGVAAQSAFSPDTLKLLLGEARHLLGIGTGLIAGGLFVAWLMIRGARK